MDDFEKLGAFYLGRAPGTDDEVAEAEPLLYDARDLTTHAVIVGMTGSGKTGLGIGLIEEAALDQVPVIAIDPKGDLGNLLLTFPELDPNDFLPWVDPRAAAAKGVTAEALAGQEATRWREGLAAWGQAPARITRLRNACDMRIYTPGSRAGEPISVLGEFTPPTAEVAADPDLYGERLQTTVTGLLTLLDIDADPLTSPEHILLSNILDDRWRRGQRMDLAGLIGAVQEPGIAKVGVIDLEVFYPKKKRLALAMRLNHLLAAPGFEAWTTGDSLDAARLLHGADGKPQVSVISIAHLSETERMFFVTMLLGEIISWMRSQPGSGSLRAILYMDEVFGYMPPVENPPSKKLLLTLLKQARAYGLGLVLSTQNPVDLDYKGLSNAGTWFIGRLQTERDRDRLLDGLMRTDGSATLEAATVNETLAGLSTRHFLLHNVHEQRPVLFETRWVMSYLAGPLTRQQLQKLSTSDEETPAEDATALRPVTDGAMPMSRGEPRTTATAPTVAKDLGPLWVQYAPQTVEDGALVYLPRSFGEGTVHYHNARLAVDEPRRFALVAPIEDDRGTPNWDLAESLEPDSWKRGSAPEGKAEFEPAPSSVVQAGAAAKWERELASWVRKNRPLTVYRSAALKVTSTPDEDERAFRIRLQRLGREDRDGKVDALRARYAKKLEAIEAKLRRAEKAFVKESDQSRARTFDAAVSLGSTLLGALFGRKRASGSQVSKAESVLREAGRVSQERRDVTRAEQEVEDAQHELAELEAELEREVAAVGAAYDAMSDPLEERAIQARAKDIDVEEVALAWLPYVRLRDGSLLPAFSRGSTRFTSG